MIGKSRAQDQEQRACERWPTDLVDASGPSQPHPRGGQQRSAAGGRPWRRGPRGLLEVSRNRTTALPVMLRRRGPLSSSRSFAWYYPRRFAMDMATPDVKPLGSPRHSRPFPLEWSVAQDGRFIGAAVRADERGRAWAAPCRRKCVWGWVPLLPVPRTFDRRCQNRPDVSEGSPGRAGTTVALMLSAVGWVTQWAPD